MIPCNFTCLNSSEEILVYQMMTIMISGEFNVQGSDGRGRVGDFLHFQGLIHLNAIPSNTHKVYMIAVAF